ncbi:uncharacterized protein EV154DRAFT_572611 [Mucor mucedo]|uniref:uncharacterized protein n=1 Tax=Mucor mucedo TaxID=29922 RepID=UPI00221FFB98|nr:uncharacterized protein EV154DRAFT_572611 [Mucor mucedo]KAI7863926.1 hypothetical protein EV154DRAFT_572611 [Mucor mucedo]
MERTIKKLTNLIKSTHLIGANASNVLRHQANYSKMAVRRLEAIQFPESMDRPDTYRLDHDNRSHSSSVQIWSPFVAQSLSGPDEEEICFGVQRSNVIDALYSYYDRKDGHAIEALTSSRIEIAGRAWKDDLVFSSIMDRTLKRLKTRANSHVLFQAPKSTGHRTLSVWFVGVVHCYFSYVQDGNVNFLAIVEVMKQQQFDNYNVVTVARNSRGDRYKKYAVISISNILEVVGLVRYSASDNLFKVVWPYIKYTDKIGHRPAGSLGDL